MRNWHRLFIEKSELVHSINEWQAMFTALIYISLTLFCRETSHHQHINANPISSNED